MERTEELNRRCDEIARLESVLAAATEQLRVMDGECMVERNVTHHASFCITHLFFSDLIL